MQTRAKNPTIDLPLHVTLTPDGVDWFIRHHRQLKRLSMADSRQEYGVFLPSFTAPSLQKMIDIDYIAAVELARAEFASKRRQIIDLTKLIVYRTLYKKFEQETFRIFLGSPLIKQWNRSNPTRVIDDISSINRKQVESILSSVSGEIPEVSDEIESLLFEKIREDRTLSDEERQIQYLLSRQFLSTIRNIMWCVLVKSRGLPEYAALVDEIRALLSAYLSKAAIGEYLALMIIELLAYTENTHLLEVARHLFPGSKARTAAVSANARRAVDAQVLLDERIRATVQEHMLQQGDLLYLTFQISTRRASIGTENRLLVTICNREQEYRKVKEQIEKKMDQQTGGRTLSDFYQESLKDEINPELGLYYLSYLQDACEKQGVRFDSRASHIPRHDLTVIRLAFQF